MITVDVEEIREVVSAIDTLQDVGLLGDNQADTIFSEFLDDRNLNLDEYYELLGIDLHLPTYL